MVKVEGAVHCWSPVMYFCPQQLVLVTQMIENELLLIYTSATNRFSQQMADAETNRKTEL